MNSNVVLFSSTNPYSNLTNMREIRKQMREMFLREFGTDKPTFGYIDSGYDRYMGQYLRTKKDFRLLFGIEDMEFLDLTERFNELDMKNLLDCQVIHLAGGNTFEFLDLLRFRNMIKPLKEFSKRGILTGMSAGSIILTKDIMIANFADDNALKMKDFKSLGLVDFEFKPHFRGMWDRYMDVFQEYSQYRRSTVYGVSEGEAIIVDQGEILEFGNVVKIVSGELVQF